MTLDWTITVGNILTIAAFAIAAAGLWFDLQARVKTNTRTANDAHEAAKVAEAAARLSQSQLQEYKTHVSETYISKQGFRETMDSLGATLKSIDANMRHMNERIDRVFDQTRRHPAE